MRARISVVAAVGVSAASVGVLVWVLTRPPFAVPAGVTGPAPQWRDLIGPITWTATGAVLLWLRPRNLVGALVLFMGVCNALSAAAAAYGMYGVGVADPQWPAARYVALLGTPLWIPCAIPAISVLFAIYPDGHLPSPRWRLPVAASVVGTVLLTVSMMGGYNDVAPGPAPFRLPEIPPLEVVFVVAMVITVAGGALAIWAMTVVRLLHAGSPERQQLTWLLFAVVPFFLLGFSTRWQGSAVALPIAIAVGVLRYHLLGIEVVLGRGLVYGVLTAMVIGVYLLITALAGGSLDHGPIPGVIAAAVVAVCFTSLREIVQRGVDKLVYGDRRDPMRAVTRVGDSVSAAAAPEDLLPMVLDTVMNAVRAPGASVVAADGRLIASYGSESEGISLALRVSGREVGTLRVSARTAGEAYTERDRQLLAALAPQVAVVVRALELAEALEAERDRVVAATRGERDRLRRDLHDGLGPSLSGVSLGIQALDMAIESGDEATAAELLRRIRAEADTAVAEVRRILEDLRPAALDDVGLAVAMQQHADSVSAGVPVDLDVAAGMPPLPSNVETAAYRIAQEALTNVIRHSEASRARLALGTEDGALRIEVADDGHGFDSAKLVGVGLGSMRHRAESLGGSLEVRTGHQGTTVIALLPLEPAT